jgi:hypothetical protein
LMPASNNWWSWRDWAGNLWKKIFSKAYHSPIAHNGVWSRSGHWNDSLQSISRSLAKAFHALRRWLIEAGLVKLRTSWFRWQARR